MNVICIAVVGRTQGNDGLERFRPHGRDLQAIEAAPRDAHHADLAGTPALLGQPVDHFDTVIQFALAVFVLQHTVGFAAAAHVDTHTSITVACKIRMRELITLDGAVALAIRQVLQDGGNRIVFSIHRQPDARRQPGAVRQGNPLVLDLAHRSWELVDDGCHCDISEMLPMMARNMASAARDVCRARKQACTSSGSWRTWAVIPAVRRQSA